MKDNGLSDFSTKKAFMDWKTYMINNGRGWAIPVKESSIGSGDKIALYLENPNASDSIYDLVINMHSTLLSEYQISKGNTETTEGSSISPVNLRSDVTRDFPGIARKTKTGSTGSYTAGVTIMDNFIPASSPKSKAGTASVGSDSFTLCPECDLLIELYNRSGSTTADYMSISVFLFESDEKIFKRTITD